MKKVKSKFWSLISYGANVTEARKKGIVSQLHKVKATDKPMVFSEENGQLSEQKAIDYIKSNNLQKQLKQIPLYPEEIAIINKNKTPAKAPTKETVKKTPTKPKVVIQPKPKAPTKK